MALSNDFHAYGSASRFFHWGSVVGVAVMIALAKIAVGSHSHDHSHSHDAASDPAHSHPIADGAESGFGLMDGHKALGLCLLVLFALRLLYRRFDPPPPLPADLAAWQKIASRWTHRLLYLVLFLLPLSGWAAVSTAEGAQPINVFGVFNAPLLPLPESLNAFFSAAHHRLLPIFAALVFLHVGGALFHRFVLKDDVFQRMLPGRK